jgi:hypothetical protein
MLPQLNILLGQVKVDNFVIVLSYAYQLCDICLGQLSVAATVKSQVPRREL